MFTCTIACSILLLVLLNPSKTLEREGCFIFLVPQGLNRCSERGYAFRMALWRSILFYGLSHAVHGYFSYCTSTLVIMHGCIYIYIMGECPCVCVFVCVVCVCVCVCVCVGVKHVFWV